MAHPWNKIGLVSAIVLASLCISFAGCEKEAWQNTFKDIYQQVTTPSSGGANTCVCTFMANGKNKTETYQRPKEEIDCAGVLSYLKNEKRYAGVSCQPGQ